MINIRNLTIEYDRKLIDQQSITFYPGQVSLIVGESGIGKTSLLYRIGLISDIDYEMDIDGIKIHELNDNKLSEIRRYRIGFVLQEKDIIEDFDVYENLAYYGHMVGKEITESNAQELLDFVCLDIPLHQDVMTLSLGERQRLAIACVLAKDPDIFILDEPTASLDSYNQDIIFDIIEKLAHVHHKYVIISSHNEKAINYADWIYCFKNQKIHVHKKGQEHNYLLEDKQHSFFPFARHYVKTYLHKYRHIQISMIFLLTLTFFIGCFSYVYIEDNMHKAEDKLYDQFDKQLFIVDDKEAVRIDKKIHPFVMETTKDIYPYIRVSLHDNFEVEVIPYFDSMNFDDRIQGRKELASTKGIYISEEAKPLIHQLMMDNNEELLFDVFEYGDELKVHTMKYPIKINGYLKNGVQNYYTNKDHPYIYVYYQDLFDFYQKECVSQKFIGYIHNFDNYHKIEKEKDNYIKNGYFVNDSFIKLEQIYDVIDEYEHIQNYMFIAIVVLSSVLITSIGIYIYRKRRKELAILKMNGISVKELTCIFGYEYCLEFIGAQILSLILLVLMQYLCVQYIYLSSFTFIVFIMILGMYGIVIKRLNVEKVLRN